MEIIEVSVYRNFLMKKWIEQKFKTERERQVAWETFAFIKSLHPEIDELLRGEKLEE